MKSPLFAKWLPAFLVFFWMGAYGHAPKKTVNPDSLLAIGNRCLQDRKPDEAQQAFEAALKADKTSKEAMAGLAAADEMRFRWGNAADWFDRMIDRYPEDLDGHYGLDCRDISLRVYE